MSCGHVCQGKVLHDISPLPSSRHRLSYDDCLEDRRENYQNCSVLCCVQQLCTMIHTHTYEQFLKMSVDVGLVFVHLFRFSILHILV